MNTENEKLRSDATNKDLHRRQRGKNFAVLGALLFLVALIYVIAIVRMSGGSIP